MRDALAVLQREGLVAQQPNRRAKVVSLGLRDVEEIYSLRGQLERLAAQRATLNATDIDLMQCARFWSEWTPPWNAKTSWK